jgi:hypothetical protein
MPFTLAPSVIQENPLLKTARYSLYVIAIVQVILAIAFFLQLPFAVNLWPFEGTTPLTFIFISSIFAAAAAPTLWAAATENYGALAGIGLDYMGILAPVAILSFQLGAAGNPRMTNYGIVCVFGVLFGLGLFLWSLHFPIDRSPPMPGFVRWTFVFFIIALAIVSILLLLKTPYTLPWMITPELSVVIGWMFVGAGLYFAYGLLRPSWLNAAGQLIGFLAYDLVLIGPFLTRLPTVATRNRLGLIVYTAVIIFSGLVAGYFLFIHRPTRMATWRRSHRT